MWIAAFLVSITLALGANPAAGCLMTAERFAPLLKAWVATRDMEVEQDAVTIDHAMAAQAFSAGVFDVYSRLPLICAPETVVLNDVMTHVQGQFKSVMDEQTWMVPSKTCAQDVLMIIFTNQFPCPSPTKPESPPPS